MPSGYSSNFKKFVSTKDLKLVGLKFHDSHTLMQQILPVAIRGTFEGDLKCFCEGMMHILMLRDS